eukprot:COSAG01_NODE_1377_length_10527_cov_806.883679_6_plen_85_part_00
MQQLEPVQYCTLPCALVRSGHGGQLSGGLGRSCRAAVGVHRTTHPARVRPAPLSCSRQTRRATIPSWAELAQSGRVNSSSRART